MWNLLVQEVLIRRSPKDARFLAVIRQLAFPLLKAALP